MTGSLAAGCNAARRCAVCGGAKDIKSFKGQSICMTCINYVKQNN